MLSLIFHRIKEVKPLPDYNLLVGFADGEQKRYDVLPLLEKSEMFKDLLSISGLFECVRVDSGGYGISWNDDIDLSCGELWENGIQI